LPRSSAPPYWSEAKRALRARDPILGALVTRYEEPPLRSRGHLFETLAHAIVGQQISTQAAEAVWARLRSTAVELEPRQVAALSLAELRGCGLSGRKSEYLHGLCAAADELRALPWPELDDAAARARLCELRGIGPWSADMALIFCFTRPDILPLGDIALVRAIERLYAEGARLPHARIEALAEAWRPWRSVATWYLWRSLDPEPIEY
jgi:DNA-3-methyladenine glycosylase II